MRRKFLQLSVEQTFRLSNFLDNFCRFLEITRMAPGGPTGLALSEFEILMLTEVRFGNVIDCLALRTNRPNPNRQDLRES